MKNKPKDLLVEVPDVLTVHEEIDAIFVEEADMVKISSSPWYSALCEEIEATRVETTFVAADTLLQGKLAIGELIKNKVEESDEQIKVTALVKSVASDTKCGERDLWACYKFAEKFELIRQLPAYNSKAISWNKVKKMLMDPAKAKEPCRHEYTTMICVCSDCGTKVEKPDDFA